MNHIVGRTKNGISVEVDLVNSLAAKHIAREPHLLKLAAEALQRTALHKADLSIECHMGRDIGYDFVVETKSTDLIFYAQLAHDSIYTRFVKKGKPLTTAYLTLVLQRASKEHPYILSDVWIGRRNPPRPGENKATDQSHAYWESHAYVFDNQLLQPRTVTKEYPY